MTDLCMVARQNAGKRIRQRGIDVLVTDGGVLQLDTAERDALRVENAWLRRAYLISMTANSVLLAGIIVTAAVLQ